MIQDFNEKLAGLRDQVRKRHKLVADLNDINNTLNALEGKLQNLETVLAKEGQDVKRLEGLGLRGLFYTILGNKEQQLDKEKQEYLAAMLKFDECKEAIGKLTGERTAIEYRLEPLKDVEQQYRRIMQEKEKALLALNDGGSRRLIFLAEEIADMQADLRELTEALDAGKAVLDESESVIEYLRSAKNWGTWDLIGGGLIATAVKHSRIDSAREAVQRLQQLLRTFYRELEDIDPHLKTELDLDIGSFLTFADYFFDGLIVDWIVQTKIAGSLQQAYGLKDKVKMIVEDLQRSIGHAEQGLVAKTVERKQLIESA